MNRSKLIALLAAFAIASPVFAEGATPAKQTAVEAQIASILAGGHRSPENRARDAYRHPKETLAFFGIQPEMTVVEISPGGGWYTEVLAPLLRERGTYYAAAANPADGERAQAAIARFKAKLAAHPAVYDKVQVTSFGLNHFDAMAPAGSADMVLTFRNVHNWMMAGDDQAAAAFAGFYRALKPGGILGVVDHRLPEKRPDADQKTSGYIKQSTVIRLAEAAGFKLVARSEINANPKDKADHPQGVWTLPPTYRLGDTDRAKYAAIGESDRMTLKFVKPAK